MTFDQNQLPKTSSMPVTDETRSAEGLSVLPPAHETAVQKAIGSIVLNGQEQGEFEGASWTRLEKLGKQQPVSIVEFAFADGSETSLVFRPDELGKFGEYYQKYPAVRQHFPRLYMSQVTAYGPDTRPVHVLEKIEGYHGDNHRDPENNRPFHELLDDSDKFEQLCHDMFVAVDDLLSESIMIYDTRPAVGHNVIYNTQSKQFQLFDIGTLRESDMTHVEKFIKFLEPGHELYNEREFTFIARMLQLYRDKYPGLELGFESPPYREAEYEVIANGIDTSVAEGLIRPSDEEYEDTYRDFVDWRGTRGRPVDKLPVLKRTIKSGKDLFQINPLALDAIEKNDTKLLMEVSNENRGSLVSRTFIEVRA